MFERFTDRARRVVVLAQDEAKLLNHTYVGTEHILLGLIKEGEGVAAKVLQSLDLSLEQIREQVVGTIGRGQAKDEPPTHLPFTPRAQKALGLSLREALHLGHNYIGTEHILLGLIREEEGVAAEVLSKLDVDLKRVREMVRKILGGDYAPLPADRRVIIEIDLTPLPDGSLTVEVSDWMPVPIVTMFRLIGEDGKAQSYAINWRTNTATVTSGYVPDVNLVDRRILSTERLSVDERVSADEVREVTGEPPRKSWLKRAADEEE